MGVNDILSALNGVLDLGDTLDNNGIGISAMTNGQHTTRELCKMELGSFLLYVGAGGGFFNDGQAGLVNILLMDEYGQIPSWRMKSVADALDMPLAINNATFTAFKNGDDALSQQNGRPTTRLTDLLISLYESFGGLMVALNENTLSRVRCDTYVDGLKARQSSSSYSASSSSEPSTAKATTTKSTIGANVDIRPYIPTGVTLTDNQKEYLCAIVDLINKYGPVDSSTVAMHMHKSTGAVSSAVSTLMKKGILDKNEDAKIVIAEHKQEMTTRTESADKINSASKRTIVNKNAGESLAKYNDRVSFALSREYEMQWSKDDDGKDSCKIVSTKRSDGDSDTPETTVSVSIPEYNNPSKDPFEVIREGDDKSTFIPFGSDPEALLSITNLDMQILSMDFRTSLYRLFIRLSQKDSLLLFLTSVSSGDESKLLEDFTKLTDIWRSLRIDGEPVDLGEADTARGLFNYLTELQQNGGKQKNKEAASTSSSDGSKAKKKEQKIVCSKSSHFPDASQYKDIHQVEGEPEKVTPFGTWSILVPPGCSYTMDPDCAGGGFTGKYPLQIQSTEDCDFNRAYDSRFSFALFINGVLARSFSTLTDLSTEEAADAMMETASLADSQYTFFKRTSNLAIMIKDATSGQEQYAVLFLIFVRGMQFVSHGQIVVHGKSKKEAQKELETILNSISAVERTEGEEGYRPVVLPGKFSLTYHDHKSLKLDDGIILPVPDGFKGSTDQNLIGAPRMFSIVPEEYDDFSKAMEARIGISAVLMQGNVPDYTPAIREKVVELICDQFEQQNIFVPKVPRVIAQLTTKGIIFYQKAFGMDTYKYLTAKAIMWSGQKGYIMSFIINLDDKVADHMDVAIDVQMIMSDWMNRIQLPGEKLYYIPSEIETESDQIDNLIAPPTPELLHEHFDLITSNRYTTRRDADFVGQSVRGLMEKCGTAKEKAYKQMEIKGDTYDLDKTALKLAQVFRMDESLFDENEDQEALIRLGAFSDVRMLHKLRSLSWMVSRYTKLGNHAISDISFSELQKMGELIEKKNGLNYDGSSGFVNLCNHYDWHVFYVPDDYAKSSTASNTDLRYLTGKENRGGNTMSIFIPGVSNIGDMNRNNDIISRNEETLESLESLRKDLEALLPVMETIYDGLLNDRDRSKKLEGALADALTAWCALAIAAKEAFYSEEAADTPEADAALQKPLVRPTDKLQNAQKPSANKTVRTVKPVANPTSKATSKTEANPATKPSTEPISDKKPVNDGVRKLELDGKTIIEKSKYMGDSDTRPIEIPDGITEIEQNAFMIAKATSFKFPRTLRIIGGWAFAYCENLESVEMQEGIEEIGSHAFAQCVKLRTIKLPSTIRSIERNAFVAELSADPSSKITLHIPGVAARQVEKNKKYRGLSAVIAAGFMIDGNWYPTLERYVEKVEAEEKAKIERERAEQRARAERERQEKERREAAARKEQQKKVLLKQIHDLEMERDSITGLFAGMKRNKLQKQIDEFNEKLRRL